MSTPTKTGKTVLVPIATGSEEIETTCIVDTLRRAGAEVTVASCSGSTLVVMSRKMKIEADCLIEDVQNKNFSMIALPGGMPGAENLRLNSILKKMLEKHIHMDKVFVAAVCAAPAVVLGSHGLLALHEATAHPAHAAALPHRVDKRIVVSGNVITSQGPGTSLEFAITLVDALFGPRAAKSLQEAMLVHSFTV